MHQRAPCGLIDQKGRFVLGYTFVLMSRRSPIFKYRTGRPENLARNRHDSRCMGRSNPDRAGCSSAAATRSQRPPIRESLSHSTPGAAAAQWGRRRRQCSIIWPGPEAEIRVLSVRFRRTVNNSTRGPSHLPSTQLHTHHHPLSVLGTP